MTTGVTAAKGFRAAGIAAGLRRSGRPDLALVVNDGGDAIAGVFTTNRVQAAPVHLSRAVVANGRARAVVLNSGSANACTGEAGRVDARKTAESVADILGVAAEEVAVASTGLIGTPLPMDRMLAGVPVVVASLSTYGGAEAAEAIRTTDTVRKEAASSFEHAGGTVTVGGMAKGAGMLAPALATMLVVLTTDADVRSADLQQALTPATGATFDCIDTDGCMSTNDTVLLLASSASGVTLAPGLPGWEDFTTTLHEVCANLATQLVDDAEGATKRISIAVSGAAAEAEALDAARAIGRSQLLKCAIHGEDPNWGRVLAALGTTSAAFDPERVDVSFNGAPVCRDGIAAGDPDAARAALRQRDVTIAVDLHAGPATATVLTTDLTAAYVHENSAYST